MRKWQCVIVSLVFMCGPALAADPVGEWLVADGGAHIRIESCADALWGIISWTREPGLDSQNPDPTKRSRSIVGVPILRSMKSAGANRWEGEVYNAQNGKMYSANIMLLSDDVLKIQGCVLGGLFCGGENWSRVQPVAQAAPASKPGTKQTTTQAVKPKEKSAAPQSACHYD